MSLGTSRLDQALAADANALNQLKAQARDKTPEAIRATAKQFESLFMRELIKSMREATLKSGLLDSPGGDLGADLLDQQFAVQMSGQAGGLSDLIAAQLARQMGVALPGSSTATAPDQAAAAPVNSRLQRASSLAAYQTNTAAAAPSQSRFVAQHSAAAERVAQQTGIPASYLIGQAGHETGWGRHEIKGPDGAPSHNLFGIKADAGWRGAVAEVTTTEYVGGQATKTRAKFRAYDSYEASLHDYARLITGAPRYRQVAQQTASPQAFASSLQQAGYASDPAYAAKLSRAIETTQHLQQELQGRRQVLAQAL